MTSPVDTSVKFFRSTMPGAPALRGQAGSLISLLDACLVNGWGIQTASSVVIADGVATATFPSDHAAAVESVVLVAGATPSGLNGEQKVTSAVSNVITWATTEADGTATGTITVKMAPAGWTKVYTGTNLAVYKSADPAAHGQFLRVNDTSTTVARVLGYETMSGVSTGTGPFPTNAQVSGGFYWGKSYVAGSTDIPWSLAADSRAFYLNNAAYLSAGGSSYVAGPLYFFGDLIPHSRSGDPFATVIFGVPGVNWQSYGGRSMTTLGSETLHAAPRKHDGAGTAIQPVISTYVIFALGGLPNPVNGRVAFSPIYMRDSSAQVGFRADLPGLLGSAHVGVEKVLAPDQVFRDTGDRARLNMAVADNLEVTGNFYSAAVDITGPWR